MNQLRVTAISTARDGSRRTVSFFMKPVVLSDGSAFTTTMPSRTNPLSAACSESCASSSSVTTFAEIDNMFTASDGVRTVELPWKTTSETS